MSPNWFEHIVEFFGRTHLLVLHFPIALITVAAVVELSRALVPKIQKRALVQVWKPSSGATTMFVFALIGTLVSVVTGLVLGFDGGERVDLHRILGIVSAIVMVFTGVALLMAIGPDSRGGKAYLTLLCMSAGLIGMTGHFGGELTHGHGYLTKPLKAMIGAEAPVVVDVDVDVGVDAEMFGISQQAVDAFNSSVLPILETSCVECHGPDEAEDDIRLDTLAYVLDPDADMVRRGDGDGSELVYRIDLPHDDPDIMPPEGDGDPLTSEQVDVIRDWIDSLSE
ncbi:MAG: c-type cytochrome domain-containing protein [Phycisphaerales bacterium]